MPLRNTGNTETQVVRNANDGKASIRRERGKVAQRAFRQRQIDTIRNLREENKNLRDAIAAISKAAANGDGATLSDAIKDAQKLAGTEENAEGLHIYGENRSGECLGIYSGVRATDAGCKDNNLDRQVAMITQESQLHPWESEMTSPPLPLDADRHLTITSAPVDIIPFLGAAAYSVAGQIHWVAMAYSFSAIKALKYNTATLEAYSYLSRVFGPALTQVSVSGLFDILHGRMMFRRYGFITGTEHPARSPNLSKSLTISIIERYAPPTKCCYIDSFQVAERIRNYLGAGFAEFEATLSGKVAGRQCAAMRVFMRELASKGLCFGDGPRWNPDEIAPIAQRWIIDTSGSYD